MAAITGVTRRHEVSTRLVTGLARTGAFVAAFVAFVAVGGRIAG